MPIKLKTNRRNEANHNWEYIECEYSLDHVPNLDQTSTEDYLRQIFEWIGRDNAAHLLESAIKTDIEAEAKRVLRGGRLGRGQLSPEATADHIRKHYIPGTDMKAKEAEAAERKKANRLFNRIQADIAKLPKDLQEAL